MPTYGHKINLLQWLKNQSFPGAEFFPISHEQIVGILYEEGLDLNPNGSTWQNFVRAHAFSKTQEKKEHMEKAVLGETSKKQLSDIRDKIQEISIRPSFIEKLMRLAFEATSMKVSSWLEAIATLEEETQLMVRSSSNEDEEECTNPGGNESYPSKLTSLSVASNVGRVCASYFSEKSILQRVSSTSQEVFLAPPICALALQVMVHSYCAGVVYTEEPEGPTPGLMVIQGVYGLGEGATQGSVPADTLYASNMGQDKSIRIKTKYIAPIEESCIQVTTRKQENRVYNPNHPILTEDQAASLQEECNNIQKSYTREFGQNVPLSIEWALGKNKKFYILQVRKASISSKKNPEYVLSSEHSQKEKLAMGESFLSATSELIELCDLQEILIAKNLNAALDKYLAMFQTDKTSSDRIKVILVEELGNDTAHATEFFRSRSMPVFKFNLENIRTIEKGIQSHKILLDVQNAAAFRGGYSDLPIQKGWLRHPKKIPLSFYLRGRLESFEQHLTSLHKNTVAQADHKIIQEIFSQSKRLLSPFFENIHDSDKIKKLLAHLLLMVRKKYHSMIQSAICPEIEAELSILYENMMQAGKELYLLLEENTVVIHCSSEKNHAEDTTLNKLYAISKLEAAMYQLHNPLFVNVFSWKTIFAEMKEDSENRKILSEAVKAHYSNKKPISRKNQELSLILLRLRKVILRDELREEWTRLIAALATQSKSYMLQALATLIKQLQTYGLTEMWLNTEFEITETLFDDKVTNQIEEMDSFKRNLLFLPEISNGESIQIENTTLQSSYDKQIRAFLHTIKTLNIEDLMPWLSKDFKINSKELSKVSRVLRSFLKQYARNKVFKHPEFFLKYHAKRFSTEKFQKTCILVDTIKIVCINWYNRIIQWNDPKDFEKNYKEFMEDFYPPLQLLIEQMEYATDLEKISIVNVINQWVEVYDLSLKAISGSPKFYQNPLHRAQCFLKLLKPYVQASFTFIFSIHEHYISYLFSGGDYAGYKTRMSYRQYRKKINNYLDEHERLLANNPEQALSLMLPTKNFIANAATIGSRCDFTIALKSEELLSMESVFTLAHKNFLSTSMILSADNIRSYHSPVDFQSLEDACCETFYAIALGIRNGLQRIGTEFSYPIFKVKYNIPLNDHSIVLKISSDLSIHQGKLWRVELSTYMMNEENRQPTFVESIITFCRIFNYKIVQYPEFPNPILRDMESFSEQSCVFELDIRQTQNSALENNNLHIPFATYLAQMSNWTLDTSTLNERETFYKKYVTQFIPIPKDFGENGIAGFHFFFKNAIQFEQDAQAINLIAAVLKRLVSLKEDNLGELQYIREIYAETDFFSQFHEFLSSRLERCDLVLQARSVLSFMEENETRLTALMDPKYPDTLSEPEREKEN